MTWEINSLETFFFTSFLKIINTKYSREFLLELSYKSGFFEG